MGAVLFQTVPFSSSYFFLSSIAPIQCLVIVNYRVLICSTCHFQSGSLFVYFGFLCLQVSSVSNFCPDTRGQRWSLIQAHLFSCVVGRDGGGLIAVMLDSCDPLDCSLPGSSVHGILQARILGGLPFPSPGGIFPIQESNSGLLYCRQIIHQLSHGGSPGRNTANKYLWHM